MVYKRFSLVIIFNILLLALLTYLFLWSSAQEHLSFTKYGFAGFAILEIIYIIYLVNKTNSDIHRFLENFIINEPFPRFRNKYKEKYFKKIETELNRIAESYGTVKLEKESEHQLLLNTLEHLESAIIATDENDKILFSNSTFNTFFPKRIKELKDIQRLNPELYKTLNYVKSNKPELIKLTQNKIIKSYSVKTNNFILNKKQIKLFSFNDIEKELATKEIINWQTLIRILRHEIINSVTPIASLSTSMTEFYDKLEFERTELKEIENLLNTSQKSFNAIQKRGKGLLDFIEKFKSISAIPEPEIREINIEELFQQIETLFKSELTTLKIEFELIIKPEHLILEADEKLIGQVLINLIKNSVEAFNKVPNKNKKITLSAHLHNNTIVLHVEDNGIGISAENTDKVFIPFYTTKKEGSGIGLSFARQVMFLHHGYINIQSKENEFTKVELLF